MKTNLDHSLEKVNKSGFKKRRAFALLTVMSMIVTSGVLWGLRDTGVTMVNEPLCSYEAHEHSEECYENVLICDMEEGEEHIHSEECYEMALTCGLSEHIHDLLCYGSDEIEPEEDPIMELGDVLDESEGSDELTALVDSADIMPLAADDNPGHLPNVRTDTVDNTLDEVEINFFDYGTAKDLDVDGNNYDTPVRAGINAVRGIDARPNNPLNKTKDLLFFSYGTRTNNPKNSDGTINPNLNQYAGDYNTGTYVSGNRSVQKIVQNQLYKNYPTLTTYGDDKDGGSLAYLFDPDVEIQGNPNDPTKTVYENVSYLMQKTQKGKYYFYSDESYAYYDTSPNNTDHYFIVNDGTYQISGVDGDHDTKPIGFFPFTQYDESKTDPNRYTSYYNHHFGMTMTIPFRMTAENQQYKGEDIEFTYSGDDDMWVFVDGALILDLGGIHEPAAGQINFTEGYVLVQDNAYGVYRDSDLRDFDLSTIDSRLSSEKHDLLTGRVMNDFMRGAKDGKEQMNVFSIANLYEAATDQQWVPDSPDGHILQVFYLERGGSYSNLAIEFLLPLQNRLTVEKEVQNIEDLDEADRDMQFEYKLYVRNQQGIFVPAANSEFFRNNKTKDVGYTDDEGRFYLKHGEKVTFKDYLDGTEYYVEEVDVANDLFEYVKIIEEDDYSYIPINPLPDNTGKTTVKATDVEHSINYYKLDDNNYLRFVNKVRKKLIDIDVKKLWNGQEPQNDNNYPDIHFNIYRVEVDKDGKPLVDGDEGEIYIYKDSYGKLQKTFALGNSFGGWEKHLKDLPVRIGRHYYKYYVKEIDVPSGCSVGYDIDGEGTENVTYTIDNEDETQINVYKRWENLPADLDEKLFKVKVKLTRKYIKYEEAESTKLTVILQDETEAQIKATEVLPPVYVGGSAEFSLELPAGAEIQTYGGTNCDVSLRDGIFEVTDIEKGDNDAGATVTIKLDTTNVAKTVIPQQVSFDVRNNAQGWTGRGDATVTWVETSRDPQHNDTATPYAKGGMLYVSNRNRNWHGAQYNLPAEYSTPGKTYSFSVKVVPQYYATDFVLTLIYTLNGAEKYENFAETRVVTWDASGQPARVWGTLSGSKEIPAGATNVGVYIESSNVNEGRYNEFYIDEFVVVEGERTITVEPGTGNVTYDPDVQGPTAEDYKVHLNSESVTAPRIIEDTTEYVDTAWNDDPTKSEVWLTYNDDATISWRHVWNDSDLGEDPKRIYTYYVEEKEIYYNGELFSKEVFNITVSGDKVSTNKPGKPVTICNEYCAYKLPETGGAGTRAIQTAGLLLITSGIMSCYALRKRKRRAG